MLLINNNNIKMIKIDRKLSKSIMLFKIKMNIMNSKVIEQRIMDRIKDNGGRTTDIKYRTTDNQIIRNNKQRIINNQTTT